MIKGIERKKQKSPRESGFTIVEMMVATGLAASWAVMVAMAMKNLSDAGRKDRTQAALDSAQRIFFNFTRDEKSCRRMLGGAGSTLSGAPAPGAPNYENGGGAIGTRKTNIAQIFNPTDGSILFKPNPSSVGFPNGDPSQYGTSRFADVLITGIYFQNVSKKLRALAPNFLGAADLIFEYLRFLPSPNPLIPGSTEMLDTNPQPYLSTPIRVTVVVKGGQVISCFPFNPGRIVQDPKPLRVYGIPGPDEVAEGMVPHCGHSEYLTMNVRGQFRCALMRCPNPPPYPFTAAAAAFDQSSVTGFAGSFASLGTTNNLGSRESGDACCVGDGPPGCN